MIHPWLPRAFSDSPLATLGAQGLTLGHPGRSGTHLPRYSSAQPVTDKREPPRPLGVTVILSGICRAISST